MLQARDSLCSRKTGQRGVGKHLGALVSVHRWRGGLLAAGIAAMPDAGGSPERDFAGGIGLDLRTGRYSDMWRVGVILPERRFVTGTFASAVPENG
jgi:hypothetical protein